MTKLNFVIIIACLVALGKAQGFAPFRVAPRQPQDPNSWVQSKHGIWRELGDWFSIQGRVNQANTGQSLVILRARFNPLQATQYWASSSASLVDSCQPRWLEMEATCEAGVTSLNRFPFNIESMGRTEGDRWFIVDVPCRVRFSYSAKATSRASSGNGWESGVLSFSLSPAMGIPYWTDRLAIPPDERGIKNWRELDLQPGLHRLQTSLISDAWVPDNSIGSARANYESRVMMRALWQVRPRAIQAQPAQVVTP